VASKRSAIYLIGRARHTFDWPKVTRLCGNSTTRFAGPGGGESCPPLRHASIVIHPVAYCSIIIGTGFRRSTKRTRFPTPTNNSNIMLTVVASRRDRVLHIGGPFHVAPDATGRDCGVAFQLSQYPASVRDAGGRISYRGNITNNTPRRRRFIASARDA